MKKTLFSIAVLTSSIGFAQVPAYYSGINFAASGSSIYTQLATLVTNTHNEITYSECWDALKDADLDEGSTSDVALIYGYDDTDGSIINDRTRDKDMNGGANGDWNREHIFPKSLGNPDLGTDGPGSDAHNLRASDVQQNGNRANKLFTSSTGDAGTVSSNWYPGDEWKGDCARIIMYMYLRYGTRCVPADVGTGTVNSTDANMVNLFLDWNFEDPVSQFEEDRNDALQSHQGNRNPFIDNPRIAYQIWGGPLAEDTWGGLGDEENKNELLTIYPNPIEGDLFYVSGLNTTNLHSISLYSITGQLVKSFYLNKLINSGSGLIDEIQNGTYILSIIYDQEVVERKLIIQ
jgi:endonuclease I